MSARAALLLILILLPAPSAWAQDKTDVITLKNGDRITGDIKSLSRGRLNLETNDAGTIGIEWDKVLRVESKRLFQVETSDGQRLLGLVSSPNDRTLIVATPEKPVVLPMIEVTRLTPIGTRFWKELEGSIDAGFSYTESSGIAQTTLNAGALYRRPDWVVRFAGSATITKQEDGEDDDRASLTLSYVRYRGKWFVAWAGGFENNQSLGLVLRSQVGGSVGQRLVSTNRAEFEVGGGVVANNEQGVDTATVQNVEGLLAAKASYYTYDGHKTTIDSSIMYYPSFSQWGRQRLQIDSAFKRELFKDFTVSFSFYYTFDSAPPQTGAARTDVGVVASIGWSFGG